MTRIHTIGWESGVGALEATSGPSSGLDTSIVRSGGYAARESWTITLAGVPQTIYMGIAYRLEGTSPYDQGVLFGFESATQTHLHVHVSEDGYLSAHGPANTQVAAAVIQPLSAYRWYYFEMYFYCHDTSGRFTMKVDGVTVMDYTGDTKYGAESLTKFAVGGGGSWAEHYTDDIVINDTNGAVNNSWPGNVRLVPIRPNAAGDNTGLTPSTGSNYQCVDEVPASGTDYVYGITVDLYDLYNTLTATLPVGSVIKNVIVQAACNMDSGSGNIALMVKSGSTTNTGASQALGTSYLLYSEVYPTNPDDSAAWEQSDIDALQIGVKAK